jgi:hypothetical protein
MLFKPELDWDVHEYQGPADLREILFFEASVARQEDDSQSLQSGPTRKYHAESCDDFLGADDAVAEENVQMSDSAKHIEARVGSDVVAEPSALTSKIVVLKEKVSV